MRIRWALRSVGAFLLVAGSGPARAEFMNDPGAPFNQQQAFPAPVNLLENIQEESATSLQSLTALPRLVIAGALILTEPAGDVAPDETPSAWSDVVIFTNTTATLYSNIFPTNNDNSFRTLEGTTIDLPANRKFIPEAFGTDLDQLLFAQGIRSDVGFTPYVAGAPGLTNTYRINSVSVPEPASVTMLGLGIAGLLGYAVRRRRQSAAA